MVDHSVFNGKSTAGSQNGFIVRGAVLARIGNLPRLHGGFGFGQVPAIRLGAGKCNAVQRAQADDGVHSGGGNQVDILNGLLQHGGALGQILRHGSALRHHQILAVRNGDQLVPAGAFIHGKLFGVLQRVAAFHGKGGGSRAAAARAAGQQQKRCGRKCGTKPKTFRLHYSAGVSVALSKVRV